ncbi:hypothetical protein L596_004607 [Steinernema carpocapsae]|uniref:histone deacetylase n=1 Tax=Steinernema carpocapsae TaxID=34508 RepID=A0A4U8UWB6_STECR|nr:hypothetical protein L596_004607 [Steinernema carpocapsae]
MAYQELHVQINPGRKGCNEYFEARNDALADETNSERPGDSKVWKADTKHKLMCVEEVLSGNLASAFALTRPPGHHAETNKAQGFCFFNNVAVAAKYAQKNFDMKRVLILDWDIHFGNGTAEIFAKDDSVLYVSLHRFAESFYPHTQKGSQDYVGDGEGAGYTVNVPWLSEGRNDNDYLLAFSKVVMPIAYEFDPELVLVSCGFDACQGENVHLGDCYLTPLGYSRMIHLLGSLANGRVIAVLEGGYNIDNIRFCTEAVLSTMVANQAVEEEPVIPYRKKTFTEETLRTIQSVIDVHGAHWKFLRPFMASPE